MEEDQKQVEIDGLDDDAVARLYEDDQEDGGQYKEQVIKQNDAIVDKKWKQFFSLCKTGDGSQQAPKDSRITLDKFEQGSKNLPAEIQEVVNTDMADLIKLVSSIKNGVLGMRMRVAEIIDQIKTSEADPQQSISLINLRVEVLAEYWSYLCLLALARLNGEKIEGSPIIMRLLLLKQFLAKLRPLYKKIDFQISRMLAMAGKDAAELNWNSQEDALMMRPNLAFEDLDEDHGPMDDDEDPMNNPKVRNLIQSRVNRAMENGYSALDKSQKKDLIRAIREKREKGSKEERKADQFNEFRKKRLLQSNIIKDMQDEMEERPVESERRPNFKGVYDPMQEKRDRMDENQFTRTIFTKDQKKMLNKRVNRLKQQDRIDDMTEIEKIGELIDMQKGVKKDFKFGKKDNGKGKKEHGKDQKGQLKKKSAWMENKDEEKYDSKRQARISRAGKIRHKKKGR